MWVSLVQSVECQNRAKSWPSHKQERILSAQLPLNRNAGLFPAFTLKLIHWLFLGLQPAWITPLRLELHHWLSWFSGLWTQIGTKPLALLGLQAFWHIMQILQLASLYNCGSWFFIIKLFIYVWRTQTNIITQTKFSRIALRISTRPRESGLEDNLTLQLHHWGSPVKPCSLCQGVETPKFKPEIFHIHLWHWCAGNLMLLV